MIGNRIEFKIGYNEPKQGVIIDKVRWNQSTEPHKEHRDVYTFCLVDYYLIRLDNGEITMVLPIYIKKIISFYN